VRLLLVEDEERLAQSLARGLRADGFVVDIAEDGPSGLEVAVRSDFDLIVLDLMLPGMNGFSVCRELRAAKVWTPILILTAKTGEFDEVEALETGADDFLTKPFSYSVLLARLRVLLRRATRERPVVLENGSLRLDLATHRCSRDAVAIDLTPREFGVLEYLMRAGGQVVSKDEVLDHVWGSEFDGNPNIVEVYVSYLRKKIDRPFGLESIATVPRVGYRMIARVSE